MFPLRDINPTRVKPVITLGLIAVNVAVFFLLQPRDDPVEETEFLYEYAVISCEVTTGDPLTFTEIQQEVCRQTAAGTEAFPDKRIYLAALASMFLHGGPIHLFGNMWFLWIFGNNIEEAFGRAGYLALYLGTGLAATLGFILFNSDSTLPLIGASGAVAGVLGAYAVLFPNHRVLSLVLFIFVPLPAMVFLAVWFLAQFAFQEVGVAWEAHVVGFAAGALVALLFRGPLLARVRRIHSPLRHHL